MPISGGNSGGIPGLIITNTNSMVTLSAEMNKGITLRGGDAGTSTSAGGVYLYGGAGGLVDGYANGGKIVAQGGNAYNYTGFAGGVNLNGGLGMGAANTGGYVISQGGNGALGGGYIGLNAGNGSTNGAPGAPITMKAGDGQSAAGAGITMTAGNGNIVGNGGDISVNAGQRATLDYDDGSVITQPGTNTGQTLLRGLPTSDPTIADALWRTAATKAVIQSTG